jgi:hypothetical protein
VGKFDVSPWSELFAKPTAVLCEPCPSRVTLKGEFDPEWATKSVADFCPVLVGANVTFTVVDWPGARLIPPASSKLSENCPGLDPEIVVESTRIAGSPAPPKLVRVTV